ncbi:MAG UNVERIFIED_CONTAM: hypothetical protein LVQ98_04605 [Rickettsiaceae bacterium]|jgi:hypothetical protein
MTQINRQDAEALFKEHIPTTFFKYGYRLVLFFPDINPQKLNPLLHPETNFPILDWQQRPIEGRGAVF